MSGFCVRRDRVKSCIYQSTFRKSAPIVSARPCCSFMRRLFYKILFFLQMFSRFIEQRSFVTAQDSLLAFFDNCLERVSVQMCLYFQFILTLLLACSVHMSCSVFSSHALILRLVFHDLSFSGLIHTRRPEKLENATITGGKKA